MTLAEFKARQLPDILIVKYAAAFKKAMGSAHFEGTVGISGASRRGDLLLLKTHCRFWDPDGGHSEGDVTLAIVLRPLSAAQ
jgi:hypothetical protein